MKEPIYIRANGRWAKVGGKRGEWYVAKGWEGDVKARHLLTYPTKDGAMISARYWIKDCG